MIRIMNLLRHFISLNQFQKKGALSIADPIIIQSFMKNPDNTFLVSFPRTGSHWLRILMELYFGKPSLTRVFFYPSLKNYLTLHTHDLDLELVRMNVIYLYRNPIDTIFSLLNYHNESTDSRERIAHWSDLYGRHLDKWLHEESFTQKKTIIKYENLIDNLHDEFNKICVHFDLEIDGKLLTEVALEISKERVKKKTVYDPQIINISDEYDVERERFRREHGEYVWAILLLERQHLINDFKGLIPEVQSSIS